MQSGPVGLLSRIVQSKLLVSPSWSSTIHTSALPIRLQINTTPIQASLPFPASSLRPHLTINSFGRLNPTCLHTAKMSSAPVSLPSQSALRPLVEFYDPLIKGRDARGRTLDEILGWGDETLERQHDYIQMLFPLPEGSVFNFNAPVVDEETMLIFRGSPGLQNNVLRSLKRMISFYGFVAADKEGDGDLSGPRLTITPKADCELGFSHWKKRMDHNHLRITRIIRCLRVLGLEGAAWDFYNALMEIANAERQVSLTTRGFWLRAIQNPLFNAPDDTKVDWLARY
ncbi:opioid growth factor receptor conserved region-domain-containing protein [Xylaria nigripes]|nr:opioid growth factor receptor conserved region-domain-containing protein [Xylaria nigripes]